MEKQLCTVAYWIWVSARDSFPGMSREEAKSAPRYFFVLRVDQEKLLSGY